MDDSNLKLGIELVQAGRLDEAARVLAKIVQQEPGNDAAWIWLAECFHEPDRRMYCMQQALKANPRNPIALDEIKHPSQVSYSRPTEPFIATPRRVESAPVGDQRVEPRPVVPPPAATSADPMAGLEMPQWSVGSRRPQRAAHHRRGLQIHLPRKLWVWLTAFLVVLLVGAAAAVVFTRGLFQGVALDKPQTFSERMSAYMDEAEILMSFSDGSDNLGAFKIQEQITKAAYERVLVDWPADLAYQRDEMGLAMLGWESVAQIADIWAGGGGCTVTGDLLTTLMNYTGSISTDKTCDEWAAAALEMATRHYNMARPGIESYRK